MLKKVILIFFLLINLNTFADEIYVKYRGIVDVDNSQFSKLQLKPSSFVKNMFYDYENKYLLVQLKSTYYQYCSISILTVNLWLKSKSLGRYYQNNIKGNFDCRVYPVPEY